LVFALASLVLLLLGLRSGGIPLSGLVQGAVPVSDLRVISSVVPAILLMGIGITNSSRWIWKLFAFVALAAVVVGVGFALFP